MNRILAAVAVAVAITASASTATAQVNPPYPGDDSEVVLSGQFTRCGSGTLNIGGALPGADYPGTISASTPITVDDVSNPGGILNYTFAVPCDFELNAQHRITFADGEFLTFCVNRAGAVAACGSLNAAGNQNLARTGADFVDDGVRVAALAIGVGALALLWRRRRLAVA